MTGKKMLMVENRNGIVVSLSYDFTERQAIVVVNDNRDTTDNSGSADFTLYPHDGDAMDCFRHPYAYAAAMVNGRPRPTMQVAA